MSLRRRSLFAVIALAGLTGCVTQSAPAPVKRNAILVVGDGMGISTITAARILAGQLQGQSGEEHSLSFERFPEVALVKTYNTDAQVPDSAGTMSAIMSGQKTRIVFLSIAASVAHSAAAAAAAFQPPAESAPVVPPPGVESAGTTAAPGLSSAEIEAAVERVIERKLGGTIESIIQQAIEKAVSNEIERLKRLLLEDDDCSPAS